RGLKENVIMGRLIPAGTGMEYYRNIKVAHDPTMHDTRAEEVDDTQSYIDAMVAATNARAIPEPEEELEELGFGEDVESAPEGEYEDIVNMDSDFEMPEEEFARNFDDEE